MPSLKKNLVFTKHAENKMRFYQLSAQRVQRVLHSPKRKEKGIAPGTIAMMQGAGSKKHPYEIWVMIADAGQTRKIISAWKYPGITKAGEPLPLEILKEMAEIEL